MKAGLYEARSLIGEKSIALVLLEDVDRLSEVRMRRALEQIADKPRASNVGAVARWALRDVGEGA